MIKKEKFCKICNVKIDLHNRMVQSGGYIRSYCKPCNKIKAQEYNNKIRKLKENTFWETE